jgi:hypothetical protein
VFAVGSVVEHGGSLKDLLGGELGGAFDVARGVVSGNRVGCFRVQAAAFDVGGMRRRRRQGTLPSDL